MENQYVDSAMSYHVVRVSVSNLFSSSLWRAERIFKLHWFLEVVSIDSGPAADALLSRNNVPVMWFWEGKWIFLSLHQLSVRPGVLLLATHWHNYYSKYCAQNWPLSAGSLVYWPSIVIHCTSKSLLRGSVHFQRNASFVSLLSRCFHTVTTPSFANVSLPSFRSRQRASKLLDHNSCQSVKGLRNLWHLEPFLLDALPWSPEKSKWTFICRWSSGSAGLISFSPQSFLSRWWFET